MRLRMIVLFLGLSVVGFAGPKPPTRVALPKEVELTLDERQRLLEELMSHAAPGHDVTAEEFIAAQNREELRRFNALQSKAKKPTGILSAKRTPISTR